MRIIAKVVSAAVVPLMMVVYVNEATAMSSTFALVSQPRQCQPAEVKVTASTSRHRYAAGTPIKVTATIRNVSKTACTVAIGGTSPSMTITNAKGVVVWDNCYANDQPGACALYLALRALNPGSRYSTARTWNQHIGGKVASRGTYRFEVRFAGLAIKNMIKFAIVM